MIISKTPFRVSFFGGGTDHPAWFKEHGGKVLATTIDKYCYISCRILPPFFDHKHRIVYSKIENVRDFHEIEHPAVRAVLQTFNMECGIEIHHDGDLPARSGLGSSSAFTVGLLNAMHALKGRYRSSSQLAEEAIYIEQEVLKENVGVQDQISSAFGGFNLIRFDPDGKYKITPCVLPAERLNALRDHLMLFFTGISRYSSDLMKRQLENIKNCKAELNSLGQMVDEASNILFSVKTPLREFGLLLDKAWEQKRKLSENVSNATLDAIYSAAQSAGAIGGKLLGAGGGGFFLLFVSPERQSEVRQKLAKLTEVPFQFEPEASKIVLYYPDGFK